MHNKKDDTSPKGEVPENNQNTENNQSNTTENANEEVKITSVPTDLPPLSPDTTNISGNTVFIAFYRSSDSDSWSLFNKEGSTEVSLRNRLKFAFNPKQVHVVAVTLP